MLNDGKILHRLSTRIDNIGQIDVSLIRVSGHRNDKGNRYFIHRLLAGCFLGDIYNKEVHHKNKNRTDNNLDNLQILTLEEHRSKETFKINHIK
jgi:hypothetical protein